MATGPGSINAESYHVGGVEALYEDAMGNAAVDAESYRVAGRRALEKGAEAGSIRFGLGATADTIIDANGAIAWEASMMRVDTSGGAANLNTISSVDAASGDIVILRSLDAGRDITVTSAGNIRCGAPVLLDDPVKTLMLVFDGINWLRVSGA